MVGGVSAASDLFLSLSAALVLWTNWRLEGASKGAHPTDVSSHQTSHVCLSVCMPCRTFNLSARTWLSLIARNAIRIRAVNAPAPQLVAPTIAFVVVLGSPYHVPHTHATGVAGADHCDPVS